MFIGHCDLHFMVQDFALYLYSMKYEGTILWILVQSDSVNDLILFEDRCDLYFMVQ